MNRGHVNGRCTRILECEPMPRAGKELFVVGDESNDRRGCLREIQLQRGRRKEPAWCSLSGGGKSVYTLLIVCHGVSPFRYHDSGPRSEVLLVSKSERGPAALRTCRPAADSFSYAPRSPSSSRQTADVENDDDNISKGT